MSSASAFFGSTAGFVRQSTQASESRHHALTVTAEKKRWEKKEVKPNSLPVLQKVHVKVGDAVKVISGKDKGKVTEVLRVLRHDSTVVCKDINLKTKHVKPQGEGQKGQIVQVERPIHSSNVMLHSKTQNVASRVGHKVLEDGRKVRFLLKTGEVIDFPGDWRKNKEEESA